MPAPLLPPGFSDLLPPQAETLRQARDAMLRTISGWGYALVRPPLLESDTALLAGAGDNRAGNTFRLPDLQSREMLAIRADMTPQIGRIAATRLKDAPRPLRLYAVGEVLRTQPGRFDQSRQMLQLGAELIGSSRPAAVAEVVLLATDALRAAGLDGVSVDLCLPALLPLVAQGLPPVQAAAVQHALTHRDPGALPDALPKAVQELAAGLLDATGTWPDVAGRISRLPVPSGLAQQLVSELVEVAGLLEPHGITITVDLTERQGFSFQTGVCFTLFAAGMGAEAGRGGAYPLDLNGEPAAGFSLYLDPLLRVVPSVLPRDRVLVPLSLTRAEAAALQADGWVLVRHLSATPPDALAAAAQGCQAFYHSGVIEKV